MGRGDKTVFVPSIHTRGQDNYVKRFFASNSYIGQDGVSLASLSLSKSFLFGLIEKSKLMRLGIQQPAAYMKAKFPDCIPLVTCYIAPAVVDQVNASLEEALQSEGYLDVMVSPAE